MLSINEATTPTLANMNCRFVLILFPMLFYCSSCLQTLPQPSFRRLHDSRHSRTIRVSRQSRSHRVFPNRRDRIPSFATTPLNLRQNVPCPSPQEASPTPSPTPKAYRIGRRFWISSDAPMTNLLRNDRQFANSLYTIQNFTTYIENRTLTTLQSDDEPPSDQPLYPCNSRGKGFHNAMWSWVEMHGLPLLNKDCITQFTGNVAFQNESQTSDSTFTSVQLHNALIERADALYRHRFNLSNEILGNWSHPDVGRAANYSLASKSCSIYQVGGVRLREKWYIFNSVTNDLGFLHLPLFRRQYLTEVMHVAENGSLADPLRVKVDKRPENGSGRHKPIYNTTTYLFSGDGTVHLGTFNDVHPADVPALQSASNKADFWVQQAQDALAPSSLAILILPLFLNIVPIASIAQVKTSVLLLYTIMSDVVTVIPLGIKGIELIYIGRQRHIDSTIIVTSALDGIKTQTATMQMWTAECRANANVHTLGVVFLVLAIVFLFIGIALEFFAQAWMKKRLLRRQMFEYEFEPLLSQTPNLSHDANIGAVALPRENPIQQV